MLDYDFYKSNPLSSPSLSSKPHQTKMKSFRLLLESRTKRLTIGVEILEDKQNLLILNHSMYRINLKYK